MERNWPMQEKLASPRMEDNDDESLKNCFNAFHALNSYQIWILAFERT